MNELDIDDLYTMNEAQIVALATQHGYTVRDAPEHYASAGKRIGGSKVEEGNDPWMNAANVRLFQIQQGR